MTVRQTPTDKMQRSIGEAILTVKNRDDATHIADLYQKANAKIRIPKSYDKKLEAVLINTSGGMTGGDRLSWKIDAQTGSHAVVTTQACEKIYKSQTGSAQVETKINIEDNACVEWLPQETIIFDKGQLRRKIDVNLAENSTFIGLEAVVLGRQAMGEPAKHIELNDQWRIQRNGKIIHADNIKLEDNIERLIPKKATLNNATTFATLIICKPEEEIESLETVVSQIRKTTPATPYWSVNLIEEKIVARFVADNMYELRKTLVPALIAARKNQDVPKVWRL